MYLSRAMGEAGEGVMTNASRRTAGDEVAGDRESRVLDPH
jgi:hypothetical protein